MRVEVDHKACLRSGQCFYLHPEIFKEGAEGFPDVIVDPLPLDLVEEAEEAADICPGSAIALLQEDSRAA
jgi:ferredoxin